jgi:hypothetical protein
MNFSLTGQVEKQLWSGPDSWLYLVIDHRSKNKSKWSIFTKQELNLNTEYTFTGYVSTSADKKVKDANGKDIYRTSFNATEINNPLF